MIYTWQHTFLVCSVDNPADLFISMPDAFDVHMFANTAL